MATPSTSQASSPKQRPAKASQSRRRRCFRSSKLLTATIYLTDMKTFAEMNAVWDGWVSAGNTPARATVEAKLAAPQYGVEIMVVAAR
jgi:enamine deaminase RidA (YjgF/YER057c/UK114 family)